jgi:hypothetical protein
MDQTAIGDPTSRPGPISVWPKDISGIVLVETPPGHIPRLYKYAFFIP